MFSALRSVRLYTERKFPANNMFRIFQTRPITTTNYTGSNSSPLTGKTATSATPSLAAEYIEWDER
jgi:hypothetical protein